ncbi:hypothetical protein MW887_002595 [Aspergillus wentii]|nr:hypothetical protein MW887_002595 [Aspergillus wentii]
MWDVLAEEAEMVQEFDLEATTALCSDHRGTLEAPGRVVTVIEREFWETLDDPLAHLESTSDTVWGAAYHIPASHAEEVHDYLDAREINGYTAHFTPFHPFTKSEFEQPNSSSPITCMVYIGLPTNSQFLTDKARREPQDVAAVISASRGKSGKNSEYLFMLEKALEGLGLGSADGHVTDLVKRVEGIEKGVAVEEEERAEREVKASLSASVEEAHGHFPKTE